MKWYYSDGGLKVGPLSEDDLASRLARGLLTPGTPVWCEGMAEWRPLRDVAPGATRNTARDVTWDRVEDQKSCSLCGGSFPAAAVAREGDHWLCASCKRGALRRRAERRR